MSDSPQPVYANLTPDVILDAVDSFGLVTSGHFQALNSYENRVYQVGLDDGRFVVVKFYRPGRWSDAAILEEHDFAVELVRQEIPVVAPLANEAGETLCRFNGFRFAVYPRRGGRWPELENEENQFWLGRFIGRIHAVGGYGVFQSRQRFSPTVFGHEPFAWLMESGFIPAELVHNYRQAAESVLQLVDAQFSALPDLRMIRLHGDCHPGNILWTDQGPHFVDLDDCMMGPAMQDLWMLLSGDSRQMVIQLRNILEGYQEFADFNYGEIRLIETLRSLRLIHYSAWLARRWDDPAFPQHFPWFNTPRYWEEQLYTLREQVERLSAPYLDLSTGG
ncbi:MAG: serine/threonine protein kinase [Gammaproteobacteria bacterium]|nr:serine/threonine protein kinase [Gammaproteobacteria bacterium]MDH5650303.1 serine/threonine protein kinase [Gammaproteobacteria bacterium]